LFIHFVFWSGGTGGTGGTGGKKVKVRTRGGGYREFHFFASSPSSL